MSKTPAPFVLGKSDSINHYIWHHTTDETMVIGNISQQSLRIFLDTDTAFAVDLDSFAGPISIPADPIVSTSRLPVDTLVVPRRIRKQHSPPPIRHNQPISTLPTTSDPAVGIASTDLTARRYTRSTAANLAHAQLPLTYLYDPSTPVCSYVPVIDNTHLYDPSTPICSYIPIINIPTADVTACSTYHTHPPDHIVAEIQASIFKQASHVHLNRDYMITLLQL